MMTWIMTHDTVAEVEKYSFFLEPKDNRLYKSDAYACTHSCHILILLILSFSLKCATLFGLFPLQHLTVHALTFPIVSYESYIHVKLMIKVCTVLVSLRELLIIANDSSLIISCSM